MLSGEYQSSHTQKTVVFNSLNNLQKHSPDSTSGTESYVSGRDIVRFSYPLECLASRIILRTATVAGAAPPQHLCD